MVRNRLTHFERAGIWRSSTKAIGHIGYHRTSIHCYASGFEPKIEVFGFIKFL
jgi:hypothetical protein